VCRAGMRTEEKLAVMQGTWRKSRERIRAPNLASSEEEFIHLFQSLPVVLPTKAMLCAAPLSPNGTWPAK
jgi:hypothetical protein